MPLADCCEGNALDTYFTLKLFNLIYKKIEELGMINILENMVMPSLEMFSDMEYQGVNVDTGVLDEVGKVLSESNMDAEDALYSCPGVLKTDNLSSNNDLIDLLYLREEGLGLYPPDRTPKGSPSVSAPTLKLLLEFIEQELANRE